jgi:exopolyphosphatase / guanosine-5'-triphosphate,3'-diphosphate pyrophosphatase
VFHGPESEMSQQDTIAAVDLGSNSFHMIVARVQDGHVHVVDRLREQVQLAGGLDDDRRLMEDAQSRGLACLERFGQRLRDLAAGKVRAVGTNTLRRARNAEDFLDAARIALGHPIEVIAGQEEARLIYLGVAHTLADDEGQRLVIDIGGGSTEFIIGERFEALHRASLPMGCVSTSRLYFADGSITEAAMDRAQIAAHLELEAIGGRYRRLGWRECIGASGTIKALGATVAANGWGESGITLKGLQRVRKALVKAGRVEAVSLNGLSRERAPVLPGGLAILIAAFEALGIERMRVSDGALREGLLYDLLGRIRHEDVRERTISALASRYHVSQGYAQRVEATALTCLDQVAEAWGLTAEEPRSTLRWAALLHEIGLAITRNGYHKHGAYLVQHSDMPGFSRQNQQLLAALIRGHRRRFPSAELMEVRRHVSVPVDRLCILLRLAVLLQHGRSKDPLPDLRLVAGEDHLDLEFPPGYLESHPLTRANLEREAAYLKEVKFTLRFG